MSRHLVIALSAHGFGHIGQVAPVVQALRERISDLRVTVRSRAPAFKLRERLGGAIDIHDVEMDVGIVQADALTIDVGATAQAYAAFHAGWERRVAEEAEALRALGADLLLANAPYLPLAAAATVRLPAVALAGLNWAGIYRHFFGTSDPTPRRLFEQMVAAYDAASVFVQPEPSMPMPELGNGRPVGPVAQLGRDRRTELRASLGLTPDGRIVVVSLGGMERPFSVDRWPRFPDVRLVVPVSWGATHPDTVALESLPMPFADVMASADALITKPGYGSFVEAACLGMPVLYLERANWPEAPLLIQWLTVRVHARLVTTRQLEDGSFADDLDRLWKQARPAPVRPTGVVEAAELLATILR